MKTLKFVQHFTSIAAAVLGLQNCDYLLEMVQLAGHRGFRSGFERHGGLGEPDAIHRRVADAIDSGSPAIE